MDFIEELRNLSARITRQKDLIQTEEATKMAFVVPFINLLGYDIFDPTEVVPEFTTDVGTKQGEKVDYGIFKGGEVIMLIECKKYDEDLSAVHTSQLFRYFSVVHARIAVLTNGVLYRFYTDLEEANKMDDKPFLEFDILDIRQPLVNELKRFTKSAFDLDETITAASDLKYTKEIKHIMIKQFESPTEDFVRFFLSSAYNGIKTQAVIQQFTDIVKRALNQFMNEEINQRLQSAITKESAAEHSVKENEEDSEELIDEKVDTRIITTEEELEGFFIVKSIVRKVVDPDRIVHRDTIHYMSIVLDNNRRLSICRLHFNRRTKYLGLFNEEKKHKQVKIGRLDDIYKYTEQLRATARRYDTVVDSHNGTNTSKASESTYKLSE